MLNVYEARHRGRDYCNNWEGEDHYKEDGGTEPIDLMISNGTIEGFCIGSILKYAGRFPKTKNIKDLKKAADYAQILAGVELNKLEAEQAKVVDSNIFRDLLAAQEELKLLEEIKQAESSGVSVATLRIQKHCEKVNEQMKHDTGFYDKE